MSVSTPRQMSLNELKIDIRTLHSIGKHVAKSGFEHLFYLADGVQGTSGRAMLYVQVPHAVMQHPSWPSRWRTAPGPRAGARRAFRQQARRAGRVRGSCAAGRAGRARVRRRAYFFFLAALCFRAAAACSF